MSTFILKLAVLANALLLAIPPGTCCLVSFSFSKSKPADSGACCCCCQEAPPTQQDESDPSPAQPVRCCCHADSTLPPIHEAVAKDLTAVGLVPSAGSWSGTLALLHDAREAVVFPSPPLQLLNCVWTC